MQCKICPVCGTRSTPSEMICMKCLTPIESVEVVDCAEKETTNERLKLTRAGTVLEIGNGDVVGRDFKGAELLEKELTVSRRHVKFVFREGEWYVVDLESTNRTYLNGNAIEPGKETLLHDGDELGLSTKVVFEVGR